MTNNIYNNLSQERLTHNKTSKAKAIAGKIGIYFVLVVYALIIILPFLEDFI